jgi:hypothetical protein
MLANLLNVILVPILEVLLAIVKPIFDMITGIISAISSAGNWLLGLIGAKNNTTNSSVVNNESKTINNQVTVNTTSPTFDISSINEALGGDIY